MLLGNSLHPCCIRVENWLIGVVMGIAADLPPLREWVDLAEAWRQAQRMVEIEAELDPLLPPPPDELAGVRALPARDSSAEDWSRPAHAGQSRPG